jgi:hypothetical protein
MAIFDQPQSFATIEELDAWTQHLFDYVRDARDPNERGADGRSLLLLALPLHNLPGGEVLIMNLLDRGADPNQPTSWSIFSASLRSNSLPLVAKLVDCGLQMNLVYDVKGEGQLLHGPSTLLDHAYAVRNYISTKRTGLNALVKKHAGGPMEERRQFIEEVIVLLEARGAKRAAELE